MPILSRVGTGLFLKSAGGGGSSAEPGEAIFHADNWNQLDTWNAYTNYTWTVPEGVTSISVVCVGGGGGGQPEHDGASGCGAGLAYKNNITVVPGTDISVVVGGGGFEQNWGGSYGMAGYDSWIEYPATGGTKYARAGGGERADKTQANSYITNSNHGIPSEDYDGGGNGGAGAAWNGCRQGGGAAGGYNGGGLNNNGIPGNVSYSGNNATNGYAGGGGGGGSANSSGSHSCGGGAGVGIYGQGSDGQHAENASSPTMQTSYSGKGGSYDPWSYETNGLSLSSYIHNTGLRGYTNAESQSTYANPGMNTPNGENSNGTDFLLGSSATRRYLRDYYDQGQSQTRPDGGFPGGGGGGGHSGSPAGAGGNGVVRIIWGNINGMKREFPTQGVNKTTVYPGLSGATVDENGKQLMY